MRLRWILALLALAATIGVYRLWRFGNERSPEALLASAREQMDALEPDFHTVLRELARALALARERSDETVEEAILRLRAEVNRRNQAPLNALGDYQALLERFAPGDIDLLRSAAQTALAADELDTARALSDRWLALEPEYGGARLMRGEVETRRAELELERFNQHLRTDLAPDAAAAALRSAASIAYLPPRSVRRTAPFGQFVALRGTLDLGPNLETLGRISATVSLARDDLTDSLVRAPNAYSLAFVQLLLRRGGLHEEAALLGQFALGLSHFSTRQETVCETAANLFLDGRVDLARSAWTKGFGLLDRQIHFGALQMELAFTVERMLNRLGEWEVLEESASTFHWMALERELERDTTYRDGSILLSQGEREAGLALLRTIRVGDPEPFEGSTLMAYIVQDDALAPDDPARYLVWSTLAQLAESLAPDDPLAPRIGRVWRDLAQAQHEGGNPPLAEYFLGRALSLRGDQPELLLAWEEWGQASLQARGLDVDKIVAELRFDQKAFYSGAVTLYDAFLAAREFYRLGEIGFARSALTVLRRSLPDLPQALVLDGWIELAMGSPERAAASWARRLEIGGPGTEECLGALALLPWDDIPSETRLRLLRAEPDHFGPFLRLRELARSGREAEAIAWFERRDPATLGDALRVEAGLLYAATGQWQKARATLAGLPAGGQGALRTSGLYLRSLIHTPGGVAGADVLRVAQARPDDADLERAIDELVAEGRMAEARAVLTHLLRPPTTRSPALAERYLAVQLAESGTVLAELGSLRASVDDLGAGLLVLASAFESSLPDELEREAQVLAQLFLGRSAHATALCRALSGELEEAALMLDSLSGTVFGSDEARRALGAELVAELLAPPGDVPLQESPEARRYTTFLTIALLALERPSVVPWALQRLRALPPPLRDEDRVHLLVALCLAELGAHERAEALSVQLSESGVADAWLVREALAEERLGSTSDAFRALRSQRLAAVGARGLRPEDLALHQSFTVEQLGSTDKALAVLDLCLRAVPNAPKLLAERARLLERAAGPLAPLGDYHRLFDLLPPEEAGALVPHYLALLHQAQDAGQLTRGALRSYVEALCVALPAEPAAVVELAWLAAGEGTEAGLERAWELLDTFLRASARSERGLRVQEEERWLDLFLRYDPERAVRFAELELIRRPESPRVWSAWTRTLHSAGHYQRAYAEHALFVRFHPEASALQWVPLYACDAGVAPQELELLVRQTQQALALTSEGAAVRDPAFVLALAAFDRVQPLGPEALEPLAAAWQDPRGGAEQRERRRLAAAYALALVQSGATEAKATARAVLSTLRDETTDELEIRLAEALLAITPH